jgi:hypothetical protein
LFRQPYIGQEVGGALDVMQLIGRAKQQVLQVFAKMLDNCQRLMSLISES